MGINSFGQGLRSTGMVALVLCMTLSGCGGGSSGSGSTASAQSNGSVTLSMTDAPGDFLSYTVDVTSLDLVKANGTHVSVLPQTTRVDFTQYTDLSELLTVATVPSGTYTRITMNLDYSNADVEVQDSNGQPEKASVVDSNGQTVSTLPVTLTLPDNNPLVVVPGTPATMALDFDLSASNEVLSYNNPAKVEVEPFMMAQLSLDTSRSHRARGLLNGVNIANQTFQFHLRPFAIRQGAWGELTASTSNSTHYEINGQVYDGSAGLSALATLETQTPDSPVIVKGTVGGAQQIDATEVLAGSSVPWDNKDVVQGTVIKRVGNDLTVRGHYINRTNGVAVYNSDITVTLSSNTHVTRLMENPGTLSSAAVSVGQEVTAMGTLSQPSPGQYAMDTTDDLRLNVTQLKGIVNSVNGNSINTQLAFVEGRRINIFDFSGTGSSSANDALANSYRIDASGLTLSGIGTNDIVKVRGYPVDFGQADGTTDFNALSVIDMNQNSLSSTLKLHWIGGTNSALSSVSGSSMVVTLSGSNDQLWLAGIPVNISGLTQLTLQPAGTTGRYAIKFLGQPGITVYNSFSGFTAAISSAIGNGGKLLRLIGHGRYDSSNQSLTTPYALLLMTR